jgi:hypothetical protein
MTIRRLLGVFSALLLAIVPSYAVERYTEYQFLTHDSAFFFWSGHRMVFFAILIILGALAVGHFLRDTESVGAYCFAIPVLLSLFYVFCDPKVCYSFGPDGLEPLRLGFFLFALAVSGNLLGMRAGGSLSARGRLILSASLFASIAYYPIVFSIAGARLVPPFAPYPLLLAVGLLSFATAVEAARFGWRWSALPLVVFAVIALLTIGISLQYIAPSMILVGQMAGAIALGSLIGYVARYGFRRITTLSNAFLVLGVLVVVLITAVFIPYPVSAIVHVQGHGGTLTLQEGTPAYVGGFMDQPQVRMEGAAVTVSFNGTQSASIQTDNYLSAGMGVHSPGCCVDGIDYGYRFDLYLFHDGSLVLVASTWEDCDWNAACGGHSWQDLIFVHKGNLSGQLVSAPVTLSMVWANHTVEWIYQPIGSKAVTFASFVAPPQENPYFNLGTLGPVPRQLEPASSFVPNGLFGVILPTAQTPGFYFFQYGLMSGYPIGHSGWMVSFSCPSYLDKGSWTCIQHSETIQGNYSYWKVLWRWGTPYTGVEAAVESGPTPAVAFEYSTSTLYSFEPLW